MNVRTFFRSRSKGEAQPPGPGCEIQAAGDERQPDAAAQLQVGLRWTDGRNNE